MKTGVFRYVLHHDVADRLSEGWHWCGEVSVYSALMWWCCGQCADVEIPCAAARHFADRAGNACVKCVEARGSCRAIGFLPPQLRLVGLWKVTSIKWRCSACQAAGPR